MPSNVWRKIQTIANQRTKGFKRYLLYISWPRASVRICFATHRRPQKSSFCTQVHFEAVIGCGRGDGRLFVPCVRHKATWRMEMSLYLLGAFAKPACRHGCCKGYQLYHCKYRKSKYSRGFGLRTSIIHVPYNVFNWNILNCEPYISADRRRIYRASPYILCLSTISYYCSLRSWARSPTCWT